MCGLNYGVCTPDSASLGLLGLTSLAPIANREVARLSGMGGAYVCLLVRTITIVIALVHFSVLFPMAQ